MESFFRTYLAAGGLWFNFLRVLHPSIQSVNHLNPDAGPHPHWLCSCRQSTITLCKPHQTKQSRQTHLLPPSLKVNSRNNQMEQDRAGCAREYRTSCNRSLTKEPLIAQLNSVWSRVRLFWISEKKTKKRSTLISHICAPSHKAGLLKLAA